MITRMPRWQSYVVDNHTGPIFTPEQCKMIIDAGSHQCAPEQAGQVGGGSGGTVDTKKRVTSHI